MSKSSGAIILTATATVTVFAAVAAVSLGIGRGKDSYSSQILEEAKKRQTISVASVPQPMETDLTVLTEEDRMAEKVSAILKDDDEFLGQIGDKSAQYVGEKISDLEEQYSSDMVERIDNQSKAAVEEAKNYTDSAVKSNEELVEYLLSNQDFLDALADAIVARTGNHLDMDTVIQQILGNEDVKGMIKQAVIDYHTDHPYADGGTKTSAAIPLPTFDVQSSEDYTEEEYKAQRNAARYTEIDKVLDFLGY